VSSSIARALGGGRPDRAEQLTAHAIVIAIAFGLLFTIVMLLAGPPLFALLGGSGAVFAQASAYSGIVFGAATVVWVCNILANVIRGTGNMAVPAIVLSATALLQIPLCGALVLGWGPVPALGIAGAGIAYVCSFALGALIFAGYILAGKTGFTVRWREMRLSAPLFWDILAVGLLSSFNAVQTIATAVIVTGLVGTFGTAALAGYGLGVRLELLQIPVVFAIGSALVVMVGTSVGASDLQRARRIAWSGGGLAGCVTGGVGIVVALWPSLWAGMFSADPAVLEAGYTYLRIAGGCYAFLGVGIALYFASQGAGRVLWPVLAGSARFVIAVAGGWAVLHYINGTLAGLFAVIAFAMLVYGTAAAAAVKWRVWN
jgi:putative MATE family efflux protein